MRFFPKGCCFLVIVSFCFFFPQRSFSDETPGLIHIDNLLVFGDSVSDGNGPFSTWKLLKGALSE